MLHIESIKEKQTFFRSPSVVLLKNDLIFSPTDKRPIETYAKQFKDNLYYTTVCEVRKFNI